MLVAGHRPWAPPLRCRAGRAVLEGSARRRACSTRGRRTGFETASVGVRVGAPSRRRCRGDPAPEGRAKPARDRHGSRLRPKNRTRSRFAAQSQETLPRMTKPPQISNFGSRIEASCYPRPGVPSAVPASLERREQPPSATPRSRQLISRACRLRLAATHSVALDPEAQRAIEEQSRAAAWTASAWRSIGQDPRSSRVGLSLGRGRRRSRCSFSFGAESIRPGVDGGRCLLGCVRGRVPPRLRRSPCMAVPTRADLGADAVRGPRSGWSRWRWRRASPAGRALLRTTRAGGCTPRGSSSRLTDCWHAVGSGRSCSALAGEVERRAWGDWLGLRRGARRPSSRSTSCVEHRRSGERAALGVPAQESTCARWRPCGVIDARPCA